MGLAMQVWLQPSSDQARAPGDPSTRLPTRIAGSIPFSLFHAVSGPCPHHYQMITVDPPHQSPNPTATLLRVTFSNVKFEQNNIHAQNISRAPTVLQEKIKPSSFPLLSPWSSIHLPHGLTWLLQHAGLQAFTFAVPPALVLSFNFSSLRELPWPQMNSKVLEKVISFQELPQQHLACFIIMDLVSSLLPALPPQHQNVCSMRAGILRLSKMASSLMRSTVSGIQCGLTCLLNEYVKWPQTRPLHNKPPMHSICSLAHFHTIVLKISEDGAGTPASPPLPELNAFATCSPAPYYCPDSFGLLPSSLLLH